MTSLDILTDVKKKKEERISANSEVKFEVFSDSKN